MLWLNQESDCLRRPAQTLPAKVRQGKRSFWVVGFLFFFLPDLSQLTNQTVMCVADPSLQSSYPAFVMYTSLIYKNMTTPVYTTLKGVSSALHCRTFTFIINSHTFMLHV